VHEDMEHVPLQEILATLAELETKIQQGMKELEEMLNPASK
jgi:type I restriction enzyme M protein